MKPIKLYHHKTDGGAEYLFDTFIKCPNGEKEGTINDKTKYTVRIDGDITKDAELTVSGEQPEANTDKDGYTIRIEIVWSAEDVLEVARKKKVKLSAKEIGKILDQMKWHHDASQGVNWDTIESYVERALEVRE